MNRPGRVLIVDDLPTWREALVEALERGGFNVIAASNAQEALSHLNDFLYHILVLDVRMVDTDQSNVEGFTMLKELEQRGLNEAIKVLMLSAYGTKDQMRFAFRDYKVVDFLPKQRFNTRDFVKTIQRTLDHDVSINLKLDVLWQKVSNSEEAVLNLQIEDGQRIQRGTEQQARAAQELDDLFCRLFYKANSILIQPMVPGYSGTNVLWVQPFYTDGAGQAIVVKYGNVKKIDSEYEHYKRYVEPFVGGQRCTTIMGVRRTSLLGGIMYSLLGAISEQIEEFASFYRRASIPELTHALDQLFTKTCGSWYANPGNLQPRNLTEDYLSNLKVTSRKLEQAFKQLSSVTLTEGSHKLVFKSLAGKWREFTNPIPVLNYQPFVRPTYVSITHGDFNQYNLLVDRQGYTWMIDFQSTGPSHILRDVAELESIVRLQLLDPARASLDERLHLEERLNQPRRFSQVMELPPHITVGNEHIEKAYAVAVHLRKLARQMVIKNPSDDISEYYVALLYNALNMVRFTDLALVQREHALLSASLLADRLGLQELT